MPKKICINISLDIIDVFPFWQCFANRSFVFYSPNQSSKCILFDQSIIIRLAGF